MQATALIVIFALVVIASLFAAPRRATVDGFFGGMSVNGSAPGLWVLVFLGILYVLTTLVGREFSKDYH